MNTIKEHITLPDDTRVIEIQIRPSGVRVVLDNLHSPGYDISVVTLGWDQLSDVELLSERFDTEAVRTFKVLVAILGAVHFNKHIYQAIA